MRSLLEISCSVCQTKNVKNSWQWTFIALIRGCNFRLTEYMRLNFVLRLASRHCIYAVAAAAAAVASHQCLDSGCNRRRDVLHVVLVLDACIPRSQTRQQPQRRPGNYSRGALNGVKSEEGAQKMLEFCFWKWSILVYVWYSSCCQLTAFYCPDLDPQPRRRHQSIVNFVKTRKPS